MVVLGRKVGGFEMRVLVVDGDQKEGRAFAAGLATYGLDVAEASNLAEAEEKMTSVGADIAVFCIGNDPFEGYLLADMFRTHNPEIFLVVALGSSSHGRETMLQYAADGWLEKPYRLESAIETLGAVAGFRDYDNPESGLYQVSRLEPRRITG